MKKQNVNALNQEDLEREINAGEDGVRTELNSAVIST